MQPQLTLLLPATKNHSRAPIVWQQWTRNFQKVDFHLTSISVYFCQFPKVQAGKRERSSSMFLERTSETVPKPKPTMDDLHYELLLKRQNLKPTNDRKIEPSSNEPELPTWRKIFNEFVQKRAAKADTKIENWRGMIKEFFNIPYFSFSIVTTLIVFTI